LENLINMIRTILKANTSNFTLELPSSFLGKQIEIIAFVVEEAKVEVAKTETRKSFSSLQLDTTGFKFNRDEANER